MAKVQIQLHSFCIYEYLLSKTKVKKINTLLRQLLKVWEAT